MEKTATPDALREHPVQKVTELDVVKMIINCENCYNGCGIVSPSNLTTLLKTSRYQIDKIIKNLKNRNIVEYKSVYVEDEYELIPPINGYRLTKKGKFEFSEIIDQIEKKELEYFTKLCS